MFKKQGESIPRNERKERTSPKIEEYFLRGEIKGSDSITTLFQKIEEAEKGKET